MELIYYVLLLDALELLERQEALLLEVGRQRDTAIALAKQANENSDVFYNLYLRALGAKSRETHAKS